MTDAEADAAQKWASMDGATAFLLIERHANNWQETGAMMEAWRRVAEAETARRCAALCEKAEIQTVAAKGRETAARLQAAIRAEFPEAFK